ncbi:hypothetical protein BHE90_011615 [Fusarium euwallaceae]|uniref:Uncharacterized protein n=1 Tax=Fusarium euwallaceae TaxID=1147111 RepID=A0A430LE31_9HYPO|nr:hypothetical protein BHE90_011615 [Fusarium euwallaceae]
MPATTILASFDEAVPIRTDPIVEDPKAHISGPSTSAAEPPKFGLRLQNFFARISLSPLNHSCLRDSYLATWEETRSLRLEADVSDASALQLINPVDLALSAHHPRQIFQLNQEVVDGDGGRARADKTWHQRLDPHTRRFAVLDYKRPGVIKPEEFNHALYGQEQLAQRISAAGEISTLFSANSNILLKQAVNYSLQYETKYIAYFDWDTLLLIYLQDAEDINGGIYCYIELLTDRSQFRRALLGFLEAAYQSQGGHGRRGPTYPTPYDAHR